MSSAILVVLLLIAAGTAVGVFRWRVEKHREVKWDRPTEAEIEASRDANIPYRETAAALEDGLGPMFMGFLALSLASVAHSDINYQIGILIVGIAAGAGAGVYAAQKILPWHLRFFLDGKTRADVKSRAAVYSSIMNATGALMGVVFFGMLFLQFHLRELQNVERCMSRGIYESSNPKRIADLECDLGEEGDDGDGGYEPYRR